MQHRIGMTIVCLHISAAIYLLLALVVFPLLLAAGEMEEALPVAIGIALFCLMLVVGIEVIVFGLHRRKFWAWVAGLCVLGVYIPSIFLPLGALGLWGLLDSGSRAEFGIGN